MKIQNELDVVNIMNKLRSLDMISNIMLSDSQKLLLQFQKQNLIQDIDSSESEQDTVRMHLKILGHPNPIVKSFYFHSLRSHLKLFQSKDNLTTLDKKILIGMLTKNIHKNFDEFKLNYK